MATISRLSSVGPQLLAGFCVLGTATLLIVPLPPTVLDLLLAANLGIAVALVLVALSVARPLSVSVFPSVLLLATLFRLGLNVASTRLILGEAWAGQVIDAFAGWVVAGSLVVGAVIFLLLTVIQFVVIARGGERVAEVAARFALDAMPGRQMAIDADLRAGAMTLQQATAARDELQRESRLFGAMDGAMKFVKGDAIAGLVILSVDLLGGVAVGVLERGLTVGGALQTYGRLTIGDGLVTQIPALLIAMAAGLIVTRVASASSSEHHHLGRDIASQLLAHPAALGTAAGFLMVLGLLPGLPFFPFMVLAALTGTLAVFAARRADVDPCDEPELPARIALDIPPSSLLDGNALTAAFGQFARERGIPGLETRCRSGDAEHVVILLDGFPAARLPADADDKVILAQLEKLLPEIVSMQDVQQIVRRWSERESALVSAVVPAKIGWHQLTSVVRELLRTGLPVNGMRQLLEALLEAPEGAEHDELVRRARIALGAAVAESLSGHTVLIVGPTITTMLEGAHRPLSSSIQSDIRAAVTAALEAPGQESSSAGTEHALAIGSSCRTALERVLSRGDRTTERIPVVALEELARAEELGRTVTRGPVVDVGSTLTGTAPGN